MIKDGDYILIPTSVLRHSGLKGTAREMFCKIASLSLANGCTANNEYFSGLLGVSTKRVGNIVSDLEERDLIERSVLHGFKRIIKLTEKGVEVYGGGDRTKVPTPSNKSSKGGGTKVPTYNRTNNRDIREIEKHFVCEVNSFIDIDSKMRESFISYWTEPNKSKTKLKFEMQSTWDLKRRLNTWVSNSKTNFGRVKDESNKMEELKRKYG
jgi:hypothetical protein